jgi:hypothetical protein
MEDTKKDLPTRECFMSSIPHGFSGEVNQFGEMACSATTPPLEINQFIHGQKGRVKMSIQSQRQFQKKKIQM